MRLNIGISWIYTEFSVVVSRFGRIEKKWISDVPVTSLKEFSNAMYYACESLELKKGGNVYIAYESDEHTHEFLELPRMAKKDLHKVLERKIESNKSFEDAAAWCHHEARHDRHTEGVLLHLMPRSIVDAMVRICDDFFFVAKRLVPLTEVYTYHLENLQLDRDEKILIVALFATRVQMVVANGGGEVLFVRELGYTWRDSDGERIVTDAVRTLQYSKQRTGGEINRIIMMGAESDEAKSVIEKKITLPITLDEASSDFCFWAQQAINLPNLSGNNFIPKLARQALTRRTAIRLATAGITVVILSSVGVTSWVEYNIYSNKDLYEQVETDIHNLSENIKTLNKNISIAEKEKKQLEALDISGQNFPLIFFSSLGSIVPDEVVLKDVEITLGKNAWHFSMEGVSTVSFNKVPYYIQKIQTVLASNPWNAAVNPDWKNIWVSQLQSGGIEEGQITGFEIQGEMQ